MKNALIWFSRKDLTMSENFFILYVLFGSLVCFFVMIEDLFNHMFVIAVMIFFLYIYLFICLLQDNVREYLEKKYGIKCAWPENGQ